MNCPVDNEVLQMSERHGIEIDYCPRCRGVWLDRGELDKIIERSDDLDDDDDRVPRYREERPDDRRRNDDRDWDRDRDRSFGHKRKKRSFLSDMFEFGD
jgi:Zn-finger nucleic acid-binding protein